MLVQRDADRALAARQLHEPGTALPASCTSHNRGGDSQAALRAGKALILRLDSLALESCFGIGRQSRLDSYSQRAV